MGYALFYAQLGRTHASAKPLRGFGGAGVVEIVEDFRTDTYRAVYTVRFAGSVYVLHAFQKKSKRGSQTPHQEMELIRRRSRRPKRTIVRVRSTVMTTELTPIRRGSGNVFADLGFPDAASHLLKASLVVRIQDAIDQRGYSQAEAGRIIGISQPDISRMLSGHFRDVSVERLMRFLQALGYEIDIVLRETGNPENGQTIHLQPQTA